MELYSSNDSYKLYKGDMRNMLDVIQKESIDAVLTDPPYELNFMGKGWDNSGIAFQKETWEKCYEVLKPGGYLLAFGGSRTFHRIACAIEDAGFEIRDTICWMYGMGFPKSMNIGKQLEKRWNKNGENNRKQISEDRKALCEYEMRLLWERDIQKSKSDENQQNEVLQSQLQEQGLQISRNTTDNVWREEPCLERWNNIQKTERELQRCKVCEMSKRISINGEERWICNGTQVSDGTALREMLEQSGSCPSYRPQSEQQQDRKLNAIQEQCRTQESREVIEYWNKFGTALKPSFEPIIVARKPFKGSLVDNVIEYGVGGINIDECRVFGNDTQELQKNWTNRKATAGFGNNDGTIYGDGTIDEKDIKQYTPTGRFPANTILTYDETDFDEVCGGFPDTKSGWKNNDKTKTKDNIVVDFMNKVGFTGNHYEDSGSASRYFYCAKASKKDRDEGLDIEIEEYVLKEGIDESIKNNIKRLLNL